MARTKKTQRKHISSSPSDNEEEEEEEEEVMVGPEDNEETMMEDDRKPAAKPAAEEQEPPQDEEEEIEEVYTTVNGDDEDSLGAAVARVHEVAGPSLHGERTAHQIEWFPWEDPPAEKARDIKFDNMEDVPPRKGLSIFMPMLSSSEVHLVCRHVLEYMNAMDCMVVPPVVYLQVFPRTLDMFARQNWTSVQLLAARHQKLNMSDVRRTLYRFIAHYATTMDRENLTAQLRQPRKPRDMKVNVFAYRMKTLHHYVEMLPGSDIFPNVQEPELKTAFVSAMPIQWQSQFNGAGKVARTEKWTDLIAYFRAREGFAMATPKRGGQNRRDARRSAVARRQTTQKQSTKRKARLNPRRRREYKARMTGQTRGQRNHNNGGRNTVHTGYSSRRGQGRSRVLTIQGPPRDDEQCRLHLNHDHTWGECWENHRRNRNNNRNNNQQGQANVAEVQTTTVDAHHVEANDTPMEEE